MSNKHKAKLRKTKEGDLGWTCGCGSQLPAMYNAENKLNCNSEDRVCSWCFKKHLTDNEKRIRGE